ncbi:MAG: 2-C-methyl-D-erythritol 4-phosphate cytidylyltransferase [Lachnospiraceae bacterium]|nr:2-C-methyl-D-erythritol 4-phosphate cytidylyltransferase [Lachnospiraceae bacterium]
MVKAIVLSGGSGSRMKSKTKKQYMLLQGKPLIYYSLHTFCESSVDEVILVASPEDMEYCQKEIIDKYSLYKVKTIAPAGSERYESVYNGLKAVGSADVVLVHDGARPFVTTDMIERSVETAEKFGSAICAMPVKDTIKTADKNCVVTSTPDRSTLWQIQTPQTFSYPLLTECYEKIMSTDPTGITDDAMIVERASDKKIHLIEGSYTNIKVTTPEDMAVAEAFLRLSQGI